MPTPKAPKARNSCGHPAGLSWDVGHLGHRRGTKRFGCPRPGIPDTLDFFPMSAQRSNLSKILVLHIAKGTMRIGVQ